MTGNGGGQMGTDASNSRISTEHLPQQEKLEFWRSLVEQNIVALDFSTERNQSFEGSLYSSELGSATLSFIKSTPHIAQRTPASHFASDSDLLVFNIVLAGNLIACQDGKEHSLACGSGTVVNAGRAYQLNITENTELAVLQVPRKIMSTKVAGIDLVMAKNLAVKNPVYPLVLAYVKELASIMSKLPHQSIGKIADNLLDLLAAMVSEALQDSAGLITDHRLANLLRIKAYVAENLFSSDLTPTSVANSLGISARYINQLLSVEDTSLSRYIWKQRLEQAERFLRDTSLSSQTISTLAFGCGFNDMAHFSKSFRKHYNHSPSEYRRMYLDT